MALTEDRKGFCRPSFPGTKFGVGERSSFKGYWVTCYLGPRLSGESLISSPPVIMGFVHILTQRLQNNGGIDCWQGTFTGKQIHSVWRNFSFPTTAPLGALYLTDSKILYLLPCIFMFRKYSPEISTPLLLHFSHDQLSYLAMTEVAFHTDVHTTIPPLN